MFSFGLDPEFVLVSNTGVQSAIGVIGGSKKRPIARDGHLFYFDNVMAECAVAPSNSREEAIDNCRTALKNYAAIIPSGLRLEAFAARNFPDSELTCDAAFRVGCKEEFCAYELEDVVLAESIPNEVEDREGHQFFITNLRTAGGHVHVGATFLKEDELERILFIRMMDLFLGIPSIYIDHDKSSKTRKQLYGQAGRYREPAHGVEYRSMGNFWLTHPDLVGLVYDLTEWVVEFCEKEGHKNFWRIDKETLNSDNFWNDCGDPTTCHVCTGYDSVDLQKAINNMDKTLAQPFMKIIEDFLPPDLFYAIGKQESLGPQDLYSSWNLK